MRLVAFMLVLRIYMPALLMYSGMELLQLVTALVMVQLLNLETTPILHLPCQTNQLVLLLIQAQATRHQKVREHRAKALQVLYREAPGSPGGPGNSGRGPSQPEQGLRAPTSILMSGGSPSGSSSPL